MASADAIETVFGVTATNVAARYDENTDLWCDVIARYAIIHGQFRSKAAKQGFVLGAPVFVDRTPSGYDGWKGAWLTEVLDGPG